MNSKKARLSLCRRFSLVGLGFVLCTTTGCSFADALFGGLFDGISIAVAETISSLLLGLTMPG